MTEQTEQTELVAETMLGDLVSTAIEEIKAAPDVWQKLSEDAQREVISRVTARCTDLVKSAVRLIAADGRQVITADLEQITAKDGIKAVLVLGKHDPQRHALLDSVGKPVLIVVADNEQFLGGEVPTPDPDQQELPVADNTLAAAA